MSFFLAVDIWGLFLAGRLVMEIAGMAQSGKNQSVVARKQNRTLQHNLLKTNLGCLNGSINET